MELILLAGNSKRNEKWIGDVEDTLKDLYSSTMVQKYKHWDKENENINFQVELEELLTLTKYKKEYAIFGKSAGSILTVKACAEELIFPQYCVFTGFAYSFAKSMELDIDKLLQNYKTPTLFIQKTNDPAISFAELKEVLERNNVQNYTLEEIPGDNHDYEDLDQLRDLIQNYNYSE